MTGSVCWSYNEENTEIVSLRSSLKALGRKLALGRSTNWQLWNGLNAVNNGVNSEIVPELNRESNNGTIAPMVSHFGTV